MIILAAAIFASVVSSFKAIITDTEQQIAFARMCLDMTECMGYLVERDQAGDFESYFESTGRYFQISSAKLSLFGPEIFDRLLAFDASILSIEPAGPKPYALQLYGSDLMYNGGLHFSPKGMYFVVYHMKQIPVEILKSYDNYFLAGAVARSPECFYAHRQGRGGDWVAEFAEHEVIYGEDDLLQKLQNYSVFLIYERHENISRKQTIVNMI